MTFRLILPLALLALLALSTGAQTPRPALPSPVLPDGWGVNIHFTDPRPGEMKMLAEGGFTWVRMDFSWDGIEREKGTYDFAPYDRLMAALQPHGIRALFILDYSNRHYDNGLSPHSEEAQAAFARWAAASAKHFAGRGILWEMYNEPNIGFWKPQPNVDDYTRLALAVGKALREAAPGETYIGPATSTIDMAFLEACFKAGLLEYWSAVSVHPYRQSDPETAAAEYRRLRLLIAKYAPQGKQIPILSGEWGYSSAWGGMTPEKQGKMLPRQWLTNVSNDVPLSIWYDWHDDGLDPKEPEHHFGTTLNPYHDGRDPVYDPKPAYLAAKTLATALKSFQFNKRLAVGGPNDYVLLFSKGDEVRLAAWTTVREPHKVTIPASAGLFHATGHTGESLPDLSAGRGGLAVVLDDAPQYLVPDKPNDLLRVAAAWQRAPLEMAVADADAVAVGLALRNPLSRSIRVRYAGSYLGGQDTTSTKTLRAGQELSVNAAVNIERTERSQPLRMEWEVVNMGRIAQETQVVVTNPLRVTVLPPSAGVLTVRVENPGGEPFLGMIKVDTEGLSVNNPETSLSLQQGQTETAARFALKGQPTGSFQAGATVFKPGGKVVLTVPPARFRPVDDFARYAAGTPLDTWRVVPDGDPKIGSEQTLSAGLPPEGPPAEGAGALKVAYRFEPGWKFLRVAPQTEALQKIEGKPKALGLWVYGDGSGNLIRLRYTDTTGQTFQPGGEAVTWKGWRYIVLPLDSTEAGHWGGANDGVIHYPIHWDTLFLLDSAARKQAAGTIYLSSPTLLE